MAINAIAAGQVTLLLQVTTIQSDEHAASE